MNDVCQSCGLPHMNQFGTEANQRASSIYCHRCYQNGEFVDSAITFDEMKVRGLTIIDQLNTSTLKKRFMKFFYPGVLKRTERWRQPEIS